MKNLWVGLIFTVVSLAAEKNAVETSCEKIDERFEKLKIEKGFCKTTDWEFKRKSVNGFPLLNKRYGNDPTKVSLLVCGVHGDENSSPYFCFRLADELSKMVKENKEVVNLTIAPLANPDGFFKGERTNANGIDINRNLPTKDFGKESHSEWKKSGGSKRKNPGKYLQVETLFQLKLIETYKPKKIVSIHSPLNFIDYDGPSAKWAVDAAGKHEMLPFKNYQTFVGSLGRFAGEERGVPTYTIELTHSTYSKEELDKVYVQFKQWMFDLIKLNEAETTDVVDKK